MASSSGKTPEQVSFYAPLEAKLSQGDIAQGIPWGLIVGPTEICRKQSAPRHATVNLVSDVPSAFKKGLEFILARGELGLAMVLWPDCQLEKFENQKRPEDRWFAGVAPVLPMDPRLPPDVRPSVRDQRRRMYFYVPSNEPLGIPESFVDLRHIWSVKQSILTNRVATLSLPARSALYQQLFTFLTYLKPKTSARCPECAAEFPLSAVLENDTSDA